MKPLSQRTLERIPKISWLFLAHVFALLMHIYVCSAFICMCYCFLLRCKPRYIPNGMWRASSLVLFVRTERTSCARAIWRFTLLIVLRQASFLLVRLVLKTKTVVIQYLALKFIATYRVLQYKQNKTTLHTSRYTLAPSADTTVTPSLPPNSSSHGRVRSSGDQL